MKSQHDNSVFNHETIIRLFVEKHWSKSEIKEHTNRSGRWLQVPSPDKTRDDRRCLGFNLSTGSVLDWYSGFKGDLVGFAIKHLDLYSRRDAEQILTNLVIESGLNATDILGSQNQEPEPIAGLTLLPEIDLPPGCIPIDLDQPPPYPWMMPLVHAHEYLRTRGITNYDVREYQLQFCVNGWFSDRVIIPVWDEHGRLVWFQARDLTGKKKQKYLNPKDVDKSSLLYGLNKVQPGNRVVIVEGIFDGWKCNLNVVNVQQTRGLVVFGKNITEIHLAKIMSRDPGELILGSDADPAGVETVLGMVNRYSDIPFKIAILPPGAKDFGEMIQSDIIRTLDAAQPWSFMTKMALIARGVGG